ncbi:eukaryotic translation initiation factor SUI1 family protein [Phanerochaete sordida]|uniref:Eukaryotic translation initiation factor SUI1 family protein n=1 Tax=Phanerochaete sordida TaxID=48140 RepID=A0A9P3LCK2_9APHY|nr:eukaryotic translation initiation factor SUI1 family protein [Phanerochaete sordida]
MMQDGCGVHEARGHAPPHPREHAGLARDPHRERRDRPKEGRGEAGSRRGQDPAGPQGVHAHHGFETYGLNAAELAQSFHSSCASSTAVEPPPGKSADMEVMVQGKQIKAVTDLLVSKGVPARWIKAEDLSGSKKR